MKERLEFIWNRLRERLWFKPLVVSLLSVGAALLALGIDLTGLAEQIPSIAPRTNQRLLEIMATGMLPVATFAVASMVSAYSSASQSATPRSFPLVVADDVSQNALSSFVGAFIYSTVSLIFVLNGAYEGAGHFVLFVLTVLVLAWVVLILVRWIDHIARLGRLAGVIDKVEQATRRALDHRRRAPYLRARSPGQDADEGEVIEATTIGYVQRVDVARLQELAEQGDCEITITAQPGAFTAPGRPVARVRGGGEDAPTPEDVVRAFTIGGRRVYDNDPRFGMIVLSEIAARALSPAVNDPGTAIDIIGTLVRLFADWRRPLEEGEEQECLYDRVHVPALETGDLFDDAFTNIARDGAGMIEVQSRLQKGFAALANLGHADFCDQAVRHSELALERAKGAMQLPADYEALERVAALVPCDEETR